MAKVSFDPIIKWFTGRLGRPVYRRSHKRQVSAYPVPDMFKVKWSQAQKGHRWRMGQAPSADPDIRPIYVQMALDLDMNPKRSFDAAVSDYYRHGNDLLWKKHMGDREKPQNCDVPMYPWYVRKQKRSRKRST